MANRILTDGQENFLCELYNFTVVQEHFPGQFRQRYHDGCREGKWGVEETYELEERGLVEFAPELLATGIMCPSLTDEGKRYTEVLQAA
jgi:hypothetical protein